VSVPSPRTYRPIALALIGLLAVGCSREGSSLSGSRQLGAQEPPGLLEQPLGSLGVEVNSVSGAGLPFVAPEPAGLGVPLKTFAYVPEHQPDASMIAWVFRSSTFGDFVVLEYLSSWDEEAMAGEASPEPSAGCTTTTVTNEAGQQDDLVACTYNNFTTVPLAGGHTGLLGHDESTTSISWAEPLVPAQKGALANLNVVVVLRGPAAGFTVQQATDAAKTMTSNVG
jgi:hypothetical protein